MAGDKPNPTQRPAPARGPGGGALQQRKRPARTASGGRRPAAQPGILRFYAEETPGLKIGPTTVTRPRRFHRSLFIAAAASRRWRRDRIYARAAAGERPYTRTPRHTHSRQQPTGPRYVRDVRRLRGAPPHLRQAYGRARRGRRGPDHARDAGRRRLERLRFFVSYRVCRTFAPTRRSVRVETRPRSA